MTRKIYTDLDATGRTITAATFSGNATSATTATSATSATSATNATNATNINISTTDGNTSDTTLYPVFVAANTTGNQAPHTDVAGITYNASTNALTATTFSGALSGTASLANDLTGGNSTTLLGAIPYQSALDTTTLLSPNTSTTKNFLSQTGTGVNGAIPAWSTVSKSDVGLGSVENTALSTWAGSANLTTLGTISSGVWNGTDIADAYIATALTGKTYNGLTVTTTTGTLTITNSKTLSVSNTLTLAGTDSTTMTFPTTTATIARTDAAQTFTGNQTFSGQVITNGNIGPTGTTALTIFTANQSSTTVSQNIIMRSGNQTGTAVSGNVTVTTGTTAGAATGALTLSTGQATSGASGNISVLTGTTTTSGNSGTVHINVGVATGTAGSINIGTAGVTNSTAPTAITLGTSAVTVAIPGRADVGGGYGSTGTTIWDTGGVSTDGALITGGTLQRTALNDGVTTSTATINTAGQFIRTTSSARYKQDIVPANFVYEDVLALEPKIYRLKFDVETFGHAREHAGFIAEDVDQIDGMKVFVNYTHDDNGALIPDGLNYDKMVSALVSAIKHQDGLIKQQNEVIESLTARIEALEA